MGRKRKEPAEVSASRRRAAQARWQRAEARNAERKVKTERSVAATKPERVMDEGQTLVADPEVW